MNISSWLRGFAADEFSYFEDREQLLYQTQLFMHYPLKIMLLLTCLLTYYSMPPGER